MRFLRLLSEWPLRFMWASLSFSSGDSEMEVCVCCSFLEVAQSISLCFGGKTDLKFEQNVGARGSVLLLAGGGEITCSHRGALLERICSEQRFT